ncbi:MAG: DUF4258 domain-containing protein [Planctomycetes bacterium]|uniref:DUF4258 domain-containing protein n=1 Tax=Candidatus Wunengus californicus TaxID=3367619 RepID=UPI004029B38D|nr:DUF4258 domain-containing protein [Planctomycetota bacterium]
MDFELSAHARDMLKEREITEEWLWRAIGNSDWENKGDDNNVHYFKSIPEHGKQILHVVVNPHVSPQKVVTVFFDRRARKQK